MHHNSFGSLWWRLHNNKVHDLHWTKTYSDSCLNSIEIGIDLPQIRLQVVNIVVAPKFGGTCVWLYRIPPILDQLECWHCYWHCHYRRTLTLWKFDGNFNGSIVVLITKNIENQHPPHPQNPSSFQRPKTQIPRTWPLISRNKHQICFHSCKTPTLKKMKCNAPTLWNQNATFGITICCLPLYFNLTLQNHNCNCTLNNSRL